MRVLSASLVVAITCTVSAAQTAPPDLRGLWKVSLSVVGHKPAGDAAGADRHFMEEFEIDVRIDWQDGHRFGGAELVQGGGDQHTIIPDELYSGAISPDGSKVHMVDDNGFDTCTLISPERLECVYRHIEPRHSVVGNSVWSKVK
ncbi:MAG: hypothetical protein AAGJ94_06405 [Pseudomonadota bacterium]